MRRLLPLLVLGCVERGSLTVRGEADTVDTIESADTGPLPGCGNPVVLVEPQPEQTHAVDAQIRVRLTEAEPDASLRLRTRDRDVPGETRVDGAVLRWEPLDLVPAGEPVELRLNWSCGSESARWTTAAPVFRLSPLVRQEWVDLLPQLDQLGDLFVGLQGMSTDAVSWTAVPADGGQPDTCQPTYDLTGTRMPTGAIRASGPGAVVWGDATLSLTSVGVRAVAPPGLADLDDPRLELRIPVQRLTDADADGVCGAVGDFGWSCTSCGPDRCVAAVIPAAVAPVGTAGLETRTPDDVASDPACP